MATGTITLHGEQWCGLDMVVKGDLTREQLEMLRTNTALPQWDSNTEFRISFTNGLVAGNIDYGDEAVEEWRVYREDVQRDKLEYVGTVPGDASSIVDYAVRNKTEYVYHLYPYTSALIGNPLLSQRVIPDWENWVLITVKETGTAGQYQLLSMYEFKLNTEVGELTNNTVVNKLETFTPYMRVQRSATNCWSGTLKSLIGYTNDRGEYVEPLDAAELRRELSSDSTIKFLRNKKGDFWRVEVSSPITSAFEERVDGVPVSQSFEWMEIGSADGACIASGET